MCKYSDITQQSSDTSAVVQMCGLAGGGKKKNKHAVSNIAFTLRNWICDLDVLLSVHTHCPSRTHLGEG